MSFISNVSIIQLNYDLVFCTEDRHDDVRMFIAMHNYQIRQVAAVIVAIARIDAARIDPPYSPRGVNVYLLMSVYSPA